MTAMTDAPGFSRVDPDTLCLSCLQTGDQHPGQACRACGFDERVPPASPLHLAPRSILHGQYLLGRVLGQGGFGITYLGWDLNLDQAVALKEYLPTDFASRSAGHTIVTPYGDDGIVNFEYGLEAFEAEARTLARCYQLPGVVDVLNYFRENGTGYIVMHYLRGRTLREHLRERGRPLPFDEAVAIMQPLLIALQQVHRLGLVHRDISPDNVYLCDNGRVCLLDFGAARNAVRDRSKSLSVQFKGGYTPEEQYRRQGQQGPWTDIYAAAATMYRALTGEAPPPALDRLQQDTLLPPSARGIDIPRDAERALLRALAVQAEHRYRSADAFLLDLAPEAAAALAAAERGSRADMAAYRATPTPGAASAGPAASATSGGVFRGTGGIIADSIRLARVRLDDALRKGTATRERAIREQLATLWPVTLVGVTLKDPHLPASPEHGPLDVYARDETRAVAFEAILQSNFAGIRSLRGVLQATFVCPRAVAHTMDITVAELVDRSVVAGAWMPPHPEDLQPGPWRIDFGWDGRKIGERGFIVSV
jgi:serine/threonine protein kinase